mgnify:CR=1 FL=1
MDGKQTGGMALGFGADVIGGTNDDTHQVDSMAGSEGQAPGLTVAEINRMAEAAGLRAEEREKFYREIKEKER